MKRFIFIAALLLIPSIALADTFSLSTTASTIYSSSQGRQTVGCMNVGAQNAYVASDGTTATSTNGYLIQANGGVLNIVNASQAISAIAAASTTTLICNPNQTISSTGNSSVSLSSFSGTAASLSQTATTSTGTQALSFTNGGGVVNDTTHHTFVINDPTGGFLLENNAGNAVAFQLTDAGNLTALGTITAGSGANTVTTAAGLLVASKLDNSAWAAPGAIGGTTPAAGTFTTLTGGTLVGSGTPGLSTCGTGALSTGSNSFFGTITSTGATSCVLTPGFTCPNAVVVVTSNATHPGTGVETANSTTTATISGQTAADVIYYFAGCR